MKVTASNIINAIARLSRDIFFDYPTTRTRTKIKILSVVRPLGPIRILRKTGKSECEQTISSSMIQRYAAAFKEGIPVNIDRVLGASYNTRSALEALLAHTPEFFICRPHRVQFQESSTIIKSGHKHLIWNPREPHAEGVVQELPCALTISELPSLETVYGVLDFPIDASTELNIEIKRRHTQIQIALALIGHQLGFRTYIAANDQGIQYNNKPLIDLPGVIADLTEERLLKAYSEGVDAARFIDCLWLKNGRFMPAVMEIEHSTGVTSGLSRMQRFKDSIPAFERTRWAIVAPDEDRDDVITKCSEAQFRGLRPQYFPYSAVEELYGLCTRRKIKGVDEVFLDSFMEKAAS